MTYNAIELAAYEPTSDITQSVYVLRVPGELREALDKLYRSGLPEHLRESARTFPIKSLNALLPLAAPDVVSVGSRVSIVDDVPWLYSVHQVDTELVRDLIHLWSRCLNGDDRHRAEVDRLIEEAAFDWKHERLNLIEATVSAGNTAKPAEHVYPLLSAFLARQIRSEGDLTTGNGDRLSFMESPWRGQGAELVSWPPRQGLPDEPDSWFSYVIVVSVQTLPFQPTLRVHVRTGVRRWVTKVGSKGLVYTAGRSVSVYLATTTAWPGISDVRSRLAIHRLRYDPADAHHVWRKIDGPGLLPHASLIRSPVDAADLCHDPLKYLNGHGGVRAAIPYNTGMGSHAVGAGLMAGDRVPFLEAVDHVLHGTMRRVASWQRVRLRDKPSNYVARPTFPRNLSKEQRTILSEAHDREKQAEAARARRVALRSVLSSGTFRACVLWQDAATRDALVKGLCDVLGLDEPATLAGTLRWSTPEIRIVLETRRSGDLCGGLDVAMKRPSPAELDQAVAARRTEAETRFKEHGAHAAVVEIDREFKVGHRDPKHVIRLGAADADTLTQFIQTAEAGTKLAGERPYRAQQAWLDLLRQLGAARIPLPAAPNIGGDQLQFVAVWAINRQRRSAASPRVWRPIAIRYCPARSERVEGWRDDIRRWVPHRDFLLWLAQDAKAEPPDDGDTQDEAEVNPRTRWGRESRQRETMAFLRPLLAAQRGRPTVLLVHAQNLRADWPYIGNAHVSPDCIDLGDGEPVPLSLWGTELRVVRVRDSDRDETPQYYGSGRRHGLPAGLWAQHPQSGSRLFYSSGERSVTGSNASVGARKEGTRRVSESREVIDTGTPAYNPNLVEICVVACRSDDDSEELASCVHQLRYAPELEKWLTLPYPLHLAKKAAEYASPDTPA